MEMAIRAMCAMGDVSTAAALLPEQRSGTRAIMSGKQVVASFQVLVIKSSLEEGNFAFAKNSEHT